MKKIYVVAILLVVAMLILSAAVPKPGTMVQLKLVNKMVNESASVSLTGMVNFYTYYLTAKPYTVAVKYPESFWRLGSPIASNESTYEVRSDYYEVGVFACGNPGAKGVMNLTHNTKLVFPLCDKSKASKGADALGSGGINQGEPTQEKVSTSRFFPGYWDAGHVCAYADGINSASKISGAKWNTKGNSVAGTAIVGSNSCDYDVAMDKYVGDGFSDGTLKGAYYYSHGGAQVRWMLDFQNWINGGVDIWH